jgi:hypothetical protein
MRYVAIGVAVVIGVAAMGYALYRAVRVGRSSPPPPVGDGPARAVISQGRHARGDLRIDPTVEITPVQVRRILGGAR